MPAKFKISYFDIKGRAELPRLVFAAAGKEFDDERISGDKWTAFKPKTPYGQMPVLTVDNKTMINQTGAIIRYLAREFGLYGSNNMENTKCDIIIETVFDLYSAVIKQHLEKDEAIKEELAKKFSTEVLPQFFTYLCKLLKENGGKFLVGSKLTVADMAVFDMLDRLTCNPKMGEGVYKDFAEVKKFYESVKTNANIQKYLERRPASDL
ncbi:prostaglandin-H2 D-isomerase / glutathione transferase [Mytilus galloprovincialis]|uniref:Prostaglandin-H2 D-isomerase / glutathione transferase n=1 Tax=Mytilus galloprovincialis TaxID=29158 RepID=A0A8B6DSK5_MYTGA|nr:prostaglandin-H2 D-isomerase / glutathione transferase [Mytilus galloprovincialis]